MKNQKNRWTFKKVLERFEEIEKKLNLDRSIIQGVPWWDKLRYELFNELLIKLKLNENLERNKTFKIKNFIPNKIFTLIYKLKNITKIFSSKSPIWIKKYSTIILGHPRRKFENGVYIDPYTDPFIDLFPKTIDFSVIERTENSRGHLSPSKTKNLFYADILYDLAYIISKFRRLKFNQKDLSTISFLEKSIYNENKWCLYDKYCYTNISSPKYILETSANEECSPHPFGLKIEIADTEYEALEWLETENECE